MLNIDIFIQSLSNIIYNCIDTYTLYIHQSFNFCIVILLIIFVIYNICMYYIDYFGIIIVLSAGARQPARGRGNNRDAAHSYDGRDH